ncbi:MAG: tetratricopeptide repeat protein [Nitrospirae bacterium]|nr:tetratricopeptide repeat protein [Nitrospirota bacterium]
MMPLAWQEGRRVAPWLAVGAILLVAAVTYRNVTTHAFVLDDTHTVKYNPALRSLTRAPQWLTSPYSSSGMREFANYRPVLVASYALDQALWGDGPAGYHATNLAIHLGVVILGFVLARRLWRDDAAALCAAGLIALHPINAEAVNYLTARSSSLMTGFVLAAIWASERGAAGSERLWSVAAYGFGLAALGTKEVAVVLPVLIIAWDRAVHGGSWAVTVRRSVPWFLLVGGFLAVRTWVLWGHGDSAISGPGVTLKQNLLFAIKIYLASLGYWLWPAGLAVDHAWPVLIGVREGMWLVAGAAGAVAATAAVFWMHRRMGWCLVWFWAAIAPAGALAFISRLTLYQESRGYLSGIALAWLMGGVLAASGRRWLASRGGGWRVEAARAVAVIAVLVGTASAVRADTARTEVWTNTVTLWDDVLSKYPESIMAHNAKGLQSLEAGQLDAARDWFEGALRLAPGFSEAHKNIGVVFSQLGDWDRAAAAFEFALKINPHYAEARIDLGKVYEHVGRPDLALDAYDRLLRDDPGEPAAWERTAALFEQRGDLDGAAARYRRVLEINPDDREARMSLGTVLLGAGRWAEARGVFEAVLGDEPESYAARFNLGAALDGLGAWNEAIDAYQRAAALRPSDPDPYFRMGVIWSKQGRLADAVAGYQRALDRDRRHFSSHMNMAVALERLGRVQPAMDHYRDFLETVPPDSQYLSWRTQAQRALVLLAQREARGGAPGTRR